RKAIPLGAFMPLKELPFGNSRREFPFGEFGVVRVKPPSGVLSGGFELPFGNSWLGVFESLSGFLLIPRCGI
ncbi:hypothetical protein, partial [Streptomyces sp. A1136]|uniref:hypothetical protein n=1 Tax=Streptomyces sp. A1136 TaxID=2563102 RepID=UPI0019CFCF0E